MALQTTGLEFFYLSVDFFENDKILLVEQELGSRATLLVLRLLARIYRKGTSVVGERTSVCFLLADCPKAVRPTMYSKWWMHCWNEAFLASYSMKKMEFLLRKAYRAITLRRRSGGNV